MTNLPLDQHMLSSPLPSLQFLARLHTPRCRGGSAHRATGFTLIEVMIVVAIIAILASIALPSYQQHILTTNRASAKACMSEFAQAYERRYTTNMTYDSDDDIVLGCQTEGTLDDRYTITAANTATTFTITATPIGAQLKDTQCKTLTLNQAGTKTASGTGTCW